MDMQSPSLILYRVHIVAPVHKGGWVLLGRNTVRRALVGFSKYA